jgi:hypothetical protein
VINDLSHRNQNITLYLAVTFLYSVVLVILSNFRKYQWEILKLLTKHFLLLVYCSLSQSFYAGGTLEIIFRSQGTPA